VALVDRAQRIITSPAAEWPVIDAEPATIPGLYTGYIVPLALIGPICTLISSVLFVHRPGALIVGVVAAALGFVAELVDVFIVALIAEALAPSFNGVKDRIAALKWVAYAATPRWIAGVANLIPVFGALIVLVAALYSLYVLYLGTVPMMKVPQDKSIGYVVVVILISIVVFFIFAAIIGSVVAALAIGAAVSSGALH